MDFTVTPQDLTDAATKCQQTADLIWQQLATLKIYVETLESTYHGMAANAFNALMTNYHTYSVMLYNALRDIGQGLNGNYYNYSDTEQQNLASLVSIDGVFPGIGQIPTLIDTGQVPALNL